MILTTTLHVRTASCLHARFHTDMVLYYVCQGALDNTFALHYTPCLLYVQRPQHRNLAYSCSFVKVHMLVQTRQLLGHTPFEHTSINHFFFILIANNHVLGYSMPLVAPHILLITPTHENIHDAKDVLSCTSETSNVHE